VGAGLLSLSLLWVLGRRLPVALLILAGGIPGRFSEARTMPDGHFLMFGS
jgi:hypothetical protein